MRTNNFAAMAVACGALALTVQADKIGFNQLPIELKDKIQIHAGASPVEDVDRTTRGGETFYEVAIKENGRHKELTFNENGDLVNPDGSPVRDSRKISFIDLPDVVKNVVKLRTQGAAVNDVDRQVKDGKISYEIGFKKNDQQHELLVSEDGRILRDVQLPDQDVGAPAPTVSGQASSRPARAQVNAMAQPVQLSAKEKLEFSKLPPAVQKTIKTEADGARIEDVERGIWRGQNIYEAAFKENGRHVELQVRENGTVFHDPRNVGRSPAATTGRAASAYPDVTRPITLSSSTKVERAELPEAVERAIARQVTARVEDIERGTWRGTTVYEIGFKDTNGEHVELQVDEKGNVVFDPRTKR